MRLYMMIDRMLFNFYLTTEFKEWIVCTITVIITHAYKRRYLLLSTRASGIICYADYFHFVAYKPPLRAD